MTLHEARPTPHVLDDYTVGCLVEVYTAQRDDLWLWDEQRRRWAGKPPHTRRRRTIERLQGQMVTLHAVVEDSLTRADDLKAGTIEMVLTKDNLEGGWEMLL